MKKILFKMQETIWWFVAELEDALYPYRDREIDKPMWAENYNADVDEVAYLKSQMNSANERIERLQSEMIHVLRKLSDINTLSDNKNDQSVERQESSETNHQTSKRTS